MEELCDRFSLVQSALAYLDNTDHLYYVKTTCFKYSSGEELLVYHFKLDVDPAELTELNAALGNFVLLKPLKATEIFQEIVFQTAQELELLPSDTTLSQISVFLKLASLPSPLEGCRIKCMKDLSRNIGSCNYVKFDGVVTGVTGISKYTRSTRYVCPHPACEGNEGHKFIRVHIAGASETQTIRKDFRCSACGSVLEEDKSSRIISDKLLAEVVHEDCFHDVINAKTRQRVQAVPVYVRDELCEKIQIGKKYQIIGMVRKDIIGEVVNLALEANNIIEISHIVHPLTPSFLPESLVCLYSDRRDSPWSFSLSLAYVFGGEIAPPGSYLQLKLGLMLSLATVSEEKPLHILGIGSEVETIQRLMDYGRQFCDRSVCHMAGCHLTGKVISDRHETAPYFIEGGSLLLAAGGVCFLGELGRLKKKVQEHLQAVLGSTKVYLELGSKHTGGLPQRTVQPLTCQIWGYSDNKPNKGKTSDDLFSHQDSGIIAKPMLDGFRCVCYTDVDDTVSREEIDTLAACQILVQSMESQQRDNRLPVSSDDFRQFFQYLNSYRTKMTGEALHLLQMYYQASRKARACSDAGTGVPVTAMQTLVSLSHGQAKLSLRHQVLEEDAVMAIRIYEEILTARFGMSILNVQPRSHVTSKCFEEFIGPENDLAMHQFHVQLIRFCGHTGNMEE
ncbi:minichromosome maintenance domain-containing protein 2-like [Haliotis cracherodii]|uniref:minichromosome maintenance domain-containing protein 2-like n=1 Tax=Haliotis cracherodii TaxID=6455 RepID=UPI0039EBD93C